MKFPRTVPLAGYWNFPTSQVRIFHFSFISIKEWASTSDALVSLNDLCLLIYMLYFSVVWTSHIWCILSPTPYFFLNNVFFILWKVCTFKQYIIIIFIHHYHPSTPSNSSNSWPPQFHICLSFFLFPFWYHSIWKKQIYKLFSFFNMKIAFKPLVTFVN